MLCIEIICFGFGLIKKNERCVLCSMFSGVYVCFCSVLYFI